MEDIQNNPWLLDRVDAFVAASDKGPNPKEIDLTTRIIEKQRHPDFLYVVAVEWWHSTAGPHLGKGDIVFASRRIIGEVVEEGPVPNHNPCKILVVEVKAISGSKQILWNK